METIRGGWMRLGTAKGMRTAIVREHAGAPGKPGRRVLEFVPGGSDAELVKGFDLQANDQVRFSVKAEVFRPPAPPAPGPFEGLDPPPPGEGSIGYAVLSEVSAAGGELRCDPAFQDRLAAEKGAQRESVYMAIWVLWNQEYLTRVRRGVYALGPNGLEWQRLRGLATAARAE